MVMAPYWAHSSYGKNIPAFLWVLLTLVVKLQWDLCIQPNSEVIIHHTLLRIALSVKEITNVRLATFLKITLKRKRSSYNESRSGSMKGVAPNGSMLASNILLIIELPAIEAARPARSPKDQSTKKVWFQHTFNTTPNHYNCTIFF